MKFKKKPVVIDAFRIGKDDIPDWALDKIADNTIILRSNAPDNCHIDQRNEYETSCVIKTLEGNMTGDYGDYIIKGVEGEIYPCKPNIFEKTYEEVYLCESNDFLD